MSEETRKVLEMLSNGKISVQEAEQLLQAVGAPGQTADEKKVEPRYFRILVNKPAREGKKAEAVNIRVPMTVVRGGLRLGALFPGMLGKKKIQLDNGTELDLSKVDLHGPRGDDQGHRRAHGRRRRRRAGADSLRVARHVALMLLGAYTFTAVERMSPVLISRRRFGAIAGSVLASSALSDACRRQDGPGRDGRITARPIGHPTTSATGVRTLGLDRLARCDAPGAGGRCSRSAPALRAAARRRRERRRRASLPRRGRRPGGSGRARALLARLDLGRAARRFRPRCDLPRSGARARVRDRGRGSDARDGRWILRRRVVCPLARRHQRRPLQPRRRLLAGLPGRRHAARHASILHLAWHGRLDPSDRPLQPPGSLPALRARGYDVTFREFAGGHEVPDDIARDGMRWAAASHE